MIGIPEALAGTQAEFNGEAGRKWIAALPGEAAAYLERWRLRLTGPSMHGAVSLVLPVERADGTPAALKLQLLDEESAGEAAALRAWDGDGVVRLLERLTRRAARCCWSGWTRGGTCRWCRTPWRRCGWSRSCWCG